MTGTLAIEDSNQEDKWTPMVVLSLLVHGAVFIAVLIVPGAFPSGRNVSGIVYEVDLVEMPGVSMETAKEGG